MTNKFQSGNIFLAGDAAHIHSPLGGRGMNIGIEDVFVFTDLLKNNKLSEYDSRRKEVLQTMIKKIRRMSEFMLVPNYLKYKSISFILSNFARFLP